ncbi:MAG: type IV secretion protein IcmB [Gammaproteobacteria bacterium]|nr:type IV secretion protein IcmB [Gammaproteobacteria bacterium]
MNIVDRLLNNVDSLLAWFASGIKTSCEDYCEIESADSEFSLVARDGSLVSLISIEGVSRLIGTDEFNQIHAGLTQTLQTSLGRRGHSFQVVFSYDRAKAMQQISEMLTPAKATAQRLQLSLNDLFAEREKVISSYCAKETMYFVLWTYPTSLAQEQQNKAQKDKIKAINDSKYPKPLNAQNIIAAIPDIRNAHESFARSMVNDLTALGIYCKLLEVHEALHSIRILSEPEHTGKDWRAVLPGDRVPPRVLANGKYAELSGLLFPRLAQQIFPRDAEAVDIRTVRVGDTIYSPIFIDLFPQEVKGFLTLFNRVLPTQVPWRIAYQLDSSGLDAVRFKAMISSILSFASKHNNLISDATKMLQHLEVNSDTPVVKLRVTLTTWAPADNIRLLRIRTAELVKAVQGWGACEVAELCGDAFGGFVSTLPAVSTSSVANTAAAPLNEVVTMLPFTRPASTWTYGSLIFRSPDGKPWPFQPGSSQQTTWIDLLYARPGSGKSVLSNALNLGLCLSAGVKRLPRIAIIDVGPSSSGFISLLKEALPRNQQHLVGYHRLRMTPEFAINPLDTQLGNRFPTPQERSFLVNLVTLLVTPLGAQRPYDGISDMAGLVLDELYKIYADTGKPRLYTPGMLFDVDEVLADISFIKDTHTTWWEITDALFTAGFVHEASLAQRYAVPLLADAAAICRTTAVEDLYGQVQAPTGESLVKAFGRMISSAVREYPIIASVTQFDLGESRIVSLDLDEVAKSGGDAADRQTAVMYMLARYVLANHYYLTEENAKNMPELYQAYHRERIAEIREDAKRIVYDEFHRTSKAASVRDQVIIDMREGRKWNVQIALISQSVDDFDSVMVEFATSIYIMDAGPEQSIRKATEIFGLSETARIALKTRVHGPRAGGATFLAQFATKLGMNTQLLTSTVGPIELWAFSTTTEDVELRNRLYTRIGPVEARRVLANLFPSGTVKPIVEDRLVKAKESSAMIEDIDNIGIIEELMSEILLAYSANPDVKKLSVL